VSTPRQRSGPQPPPPGTQVAITLTAKPGDHAIVRVIAAPHRELADPGRAAQLLEPFAGALLVDVRVGERLVLPGAWVRREVVDRGEPRPPRPVRPTDLRPPAVIVGEGQDAALHWGLTSWPLALQAPLAIPAAARPDPHPVARLRRLVLVALGRRDEVALTLWRQDGFEVPWHDVRLIPRAAWWFEIAQVPPGTRYADAEAAQQVGRASPGQWPMGPSS